VNGVPSKALLTAFKWGRGSGLQLQLIIADARGKIIGRADTNVGYFGEELEEEKPKPPSPNEPKLKFSAEAKAIMEFVRSGWGGGESATKLPPELRARILAPEQHDPLSLLASPLSITLSEAKKANLVAHIPDSMMWGFYFDPKQEPTVAQLSPLCATPW
jgi:hypothetical protein